MKKHKQLTEHYLLPLNLCFLSFFGLFLIYELDKLLMVGSQQSTASFTLAACAGTAIFLIGSVKFRNAYFQGLCVMLSVIALVILSCPL